MKLLLRSAGVFRRHPRLRRYLWKPLAISTALFMVAAAITMVVLAASLSALAGSLGVPAEAGLLVGLIAGLLAFLFFSGPIFVALGSLVSSFHWDLLGRRIEEAEYGRVEFSPLNGGRLGLEIALRIAFAVLVLACSLPLLFTPLAPLACLLNGLLAFADFTGAAMQRRGRSFPGSLLSAFRLKGAFGLYLCCCLASLFPLVFLFLHPFFAVSGTLLLADLEATPRT